MYERYVNCYVQLKAKQCRDSKKILDQRVVTIFRHVTFPEEFLSRFYHVFTVRDH